ncbi:dihydroxyacetone kinase family protein [Subtercola boreus]|uniref:D-erythrulose kinase n=1 Tax=Subtercola boreus TaxID=120213 RepID=A0A3E0WAW9_9MICO|nr:dihydroxyacetone kinase family protein [Subtercola boreus]RFA20028.1 D-erythrulose kinase [Subtercola boreus]RFA20157.1 D-erythrulose kinase [Subtercola boreus]RFA26484.1 D-erythrulose kinase [Subtercola boreus]
MTNLLIDATTFAETAIDGFVLANPGHVRRVDGGVVRSSVIPEGRVAVVVGGGSGHYPAFAGIVGPGLAAAAVCGNIFASPASGQAYRVCRAVERGAGVLLTFGNYAGDVLQFGMAAERLRGEGVDVRVVTVTDDVASATADEIAKRRGIAGDLTVFKAAGAAAEAGADLDEVERIAQLANSRTRSFGVAFSGCTLPGADEPLFTVPDGMMAVGLGIHGEPGISEVPVPSAPDLAALLVERLLDELPGDVPTASGARAVVILNGLGDFKYEELFVVYASVHRLLGEAGVIVADTECGELVTSLDMSGVSLTLFWVTDELEELWRAPADTPAYRTGSIDAEPDTRDHGVSDAAADVRRTVSGPEETAAAQQVLVCLEAVHRMIVASEDEFGRIDAIAGDGDHGIGMSRGATGALAAAKSVVAEQGSLAELLAEAGEAWSENGGGTSGALWGIALTAAGASLPPSSEVSATAVSSAVDAALAAIQNLGKAEVGDKTLVDAFVPFADELRRRVSAGEALTASWTGAATASVRAAEATADLEPRLGRARPHVERSLGHPDAGAVSFARIVTTVGDRLGDLPHE